MATGRGSWMRWYFSLAHSLSNGASCLSWATFIKRYLTSFRTSSRDICTPGPFGEHSPCAVASTFDTGPTAVSKAASKEPSSRPARIFDLANWRISSTLLFLYSWALCKWSAKAPERRARRSVSFVAWRVLFATVAVWLSMASWSLPSAMPRSKCCLASCRKTCVAEVHTVSGTCKSRSSTPSMPPGDSMVASCPSEYHVSWVSPMPGNVARVKDGATVEVVLKFRRFHCNEAVSSSCVTNFCLTYVLKPRAPRPSSLESPAFSAELSPGTAAMAASTDRKKPLPSASMWALTSSAAASLLHRTLALMTTAPRPLSTSMPATSPEFAADARTSVTAVNRPERRWPPLRRAL
mmetsp:Transcript_33783/g.97076  ORF Transcript_33783/g.97076 Transcript_33783/m.97076 type:complete len:351 (-) Transcript_33783:1082-2134(-)